MTKELRSSMHLSGARVCTSMDDDPVIVPRAVDLFNSATMHTLGRAIVLIAPGIKTSDRERDKLEKAIDAVARDFKLLVLSGSRGFRRAPSWVAFSHTAMMTFGLTLTASDRWRVKRTFNLFGGVPFRRVAPSSRSRDYDIPWLCSAIAFEYQRDRSGMGLHLDRL